MRKEFENVHDILEQVMGDKTVPKNIRDKVQEILEECCKDDKETSLIVDTVIQDLDNINSDPNLPAFTRTQIWNVVSLLESCQEIS